MTAHDVNDVRARLLPCPFCGREPIPGHGMSGDVTLYNVRCRCGAGVNDFFDRQEADDAWNTRAAHADLAGEVRELVERWRTRMPANAPDTTRVLMREFCADQLEATLAKFPTQRAGGGE
ncbi:Lar family restriction alleviation protein [Frateuria terrea]|uniref:Restriction alleviation protein, Lar family n=1 Tax=Frateuria terrea TaxID=529704 RepID=A0A1H6ZR65_9GAMM|nr:Lar family restriction alleviation protein [Frateuria terrea]SEJ54654.1 restriction alleviation protein, Lar family [Frateuria terrea]SFP47766.1 restriction alleviation protein, Lar family [Frateuria terrea]